MDEQKNQKLFLTKAVIVAAGIFIASSIALITKIPFGFLSIITVFVLMQLFFTQLRAKSIERIIGPTLSSILLILILTLFHNHFVLMFLSSTLLLMIFVYYFAVGYFPYSMIMGAITISLISDEFE